MSSGSPHRGRRDNGLDAADYAAAGDVDPRVGEHLLDVLAAAGIAAYLQPAVDLNPVTREAVMPARPLDRLFVARTHLRTARDHLARALGQDVDDAWAEILAGYHTEVDATAASWPESENVTVRRADELAGAPNQDLGPDAGRWRTPPAPDEQPSLLSALDTFGRDLPDDPDDDEGYTPAPAPPLPRLSKYAVSAVLGIVAGFILFLRPELLPIDPDVAMLVGFGAVLAGFATLVWRLRPGDDEDDYDSDDGARV